MNAAFFCGRISDLSWVPEKPVLSLSISIMSVTTIKYMGFKHLTT